jgi:hypothetical protein
MMMKRIQTTNRLPPLICLAALISAALFFTACEQPASSSKGSGSGDDGVDSGVDNGGEEPDDGVRTFTTQYQEYPPAFLITLDKDVEGLSAEDIELSIEKAVEGNGYQRGTLGGPDGDHTYTLPISYKNGHIIVGSKGTREPISATLNIAKEAYTFTDVSETALDITFRRAVWTDVTADPPASTSTKTSKLRFAFEQAMPDFTKTDIILGNTQYPIKTTITGEPVDIGAFTYEVPVSGVSSVGGAQLLIVNIIKSGYYFVRQNTTFAPMPMPFGVNVFYEKSGED